MINSCFMLSHIEKICSTHGKYNFQTESELSTQLQVKKKKFFFYPEIMIMTVPSNKIRAQKLHTGIVYIKTRSENHLF